MRHYSARQRTDGRWDYTCGSRAVGYCCEYRPISEDGSIGIPPELAKQENEKLAPLVGNFHTDGHATEEEACECYKRYLLDTRLRLMTEEPANASSQHRCEVCKTFTACNAQVGSYRMFTLCPEHQTRGDVSALLEVGESWES